jgi:hypothetical protein
MRSKIMRIKLIVSKLRSHDGNAKQTNAYFVSIHGVILIKDTYNTMYTPTYGV